MTPLILVEIINTLLEAGLFVIVGLDILLYYNREKKQEIRDQNQDRREQQYLELQQQVVKLLNEQVEGIDSAVEELADINDQHVILEEGQDEKQTTQNPEVPSHS